MKKAVNMNIGNLRVEVYSGNSTIKLKRASVKITRHFCHSKEIKKPAVFSASTGLLGFVIFKDIPLDVYKVEISGKWYEPTISKNTSVHIPGKDPVGHFVKPNNLAKIQYPKVAPWMSTAMKELGQKEVPGKKSNPQIMEYFKASKFWGKDDSGSENAWCASFTSWVMKQHSYAKPKSAYRAKSWLNFGKTLSKPVYGAIGIKSRVGGGHVAFVVGQSKDGKLLYMLGGNQKDEVNIRSYDKSIWEKFVVPTDYDAKNDLLPVYNKEAKAAGRED